MNRAIDHVQTHLHRPLPLEEVAQIACFSPFHFHRIFKAHTGETLNRFVGRLRLEKALRLMSREADLSLTDIAHRCGFASSSDFTRAFKRLHGVAPSAFDIEGHRKGGRAQLDDVVDSSTVDGRVDRPRSAIENPDGFEVEFISLPSRRVAYRRVLAPYREGVVEAAYVEHMRWALAHQVLDCPWLGYMWEDPEVTDLEVCRYDVAVIVPEDMRWNEVEVGSFSFPAMTVASVELRGGLDLALRCMDWLFNTWLPSSGYVPEDLPCFEAWLGQPYAHGNEHYELCAQLPVRRA